MLDVVASRAERPSPTTRWPSPARMTTPDSLSPTQVARLTSHCRPKRPTASPCASTKTLEGFEWPGINNPPPVGTVVPYLRKPDGANGYIGAPHDKATDSLEIVYRPAWPAITPTLQFGETLWEPRTVCPPFEARAACRFSTSSPSPPTSPRPTPASPSMIPPAKRPATSSQPDWTPCPPD